jgi:hypothetical protein
MLLAKQLFHYRFFLPGPLVLGISPLINLKLTVDNDRTVSQRSKPSSCTTLIGEQPNPWNRFQHRDVISRHRGAGPLHR